MGVNCPFSPQGTRENGIKLRREVGIEMKPEFPNCVGSQTLKYVSKEVYGHEFIFEC